MTTPNTNHQYDAIWWAIFDWTEGVQGADAGALAERVNRAITTTMQQHIAADRIARAEQDQAESTTHHA